MWRVGSRITEEWEIVRSRLAFHGGMSVRPSVQLVRDHRREVRTKPENSRPLVLHFEPTEVPQTTDGSLTGLG